MVVVVERRKKDEQEELTHTHTHTERERERERRGIKETAAVAQQWRQWCSDRQQKISNRYTNIKVERACEQTNANANIECDINNKCNGASESTMVSEAI
jgi:hypothetical protein